MRQIEQLIFPLVKTHFPEFYQDEGSRFVDFVKEYYRWMEQQDQALNASRNLLDYRNIDTTSEEFVQYFKNKYLQGLPLTTEANTQFLVKHASDFYKSKGTERGVKLVMQGLFNEEANLYFPGNDLFKSSDGTWVKPVYLELSVSERSKTFVGKEVVGSNSGAKAFFESLVRRRIGTKYLEVAYLSNVRGDFITGEQITTTANQVLENAPTVIGSMTSLTVIAGGAEFAVGDLFDVVSSNGKQGVARVTEISNETGRVSFIFIDALNSGGWGYSLDHANVIISAKVLILTNIVNSNSDVTDFQRFERVTQQLANVGYVSARGNNVNFDVGNVIENYNLDGTVNANGIIVATSKTTANTGYIIIAPATGNLVTIDTTFAIRASSADTANFNASLVGDVLYSFTRSFTGSYVGYYTGTYSGTFTGGYVGSFSGAYTSEYLRGWSGAYAGNVTHSFSGEYTGAFSRVFTGSYLGTYTKEYTGSYTNLYNSPAGSSFSRAFVSYYVNNPYAGTVYAGPGYTGTFNQSGYTGTYGAGSFTGLPYPWGGGGVYSGTWTGAWTQSWTAVYAGGYNTSFTGEYAGGYTGAFSGAFARLWTGSYTNVFSGEYTAAYSSAWTSTYNQTFSGPYTQNFSGAYAGTYVGNYTGFFTSVFTGVSLINTVAAHNFSNGNIVRYHVAVGNTQIAQLSIGAAYYVVNAVPGTTTLQLSNTSGGSPLSLTKGSNETGHFLIETLGTGVITSYNDRTASGNVVGSNTTAGNTATGNTGFLGVTDLSSNGFIITPYANIVGYISNTTALVANVSTGTGANLNISLLTDTENVFLTPDFLSSNNTGNVVFHSVLLNGFNANTNAAGYGTDDTFNASTNVTAGTGGDGVKLPTTVIFNANSGVANTTDIITTSTAHVFGNNEQVVYTTHPSNTVITGLANNTTYYVVNAIAGGLALQLSTTSGGSPIDLTANSSSALAIGHFLARAGTTGSNNTIAFSNAINYSPNTAIRYYVNTGNTVVSGLTTNTVYYVDQSNATHVSLKATQAGTRIALTAGSSETGHHLIGPLRILSTGDIQHRGLGFVKFPGTNMDTVLLDALRFDATVIGSIAAISGLNPGSDYNVDPFVVVHDTYVAGYDKHDYLMRISSPSGVFLTGEQIQQTYDSPATLLTVNTFVGTYANGTPATTFVETEFVYQSNSTANVAASGFVLQAEINGAGAGSVKLRNVTGTFVATTSSTTLIKGLSSGSTSNASAAALTTFATTARALVKSGSNTSTLSLKRINLENTFIAGSTIIGRSSGVTATVSVIDQDLTTIPVGLNASIEANVQTANNVVKSLDVYDSGFGYVDQETVTLTKTDSQYEITAIVELGKQGIGAGFFSSTRGFLDEDKKLQDNNYYQEYSYEIQTKIPFDKYFEVLKKITHVAGTKAFGKVNSLSSANMTMTVINSIVIS